MKQDMIAAWHWFKNRSGSKKLLLVIILMSMLDTAYQKAMDTMHPFRFNKYDSVEIATAALQRLYPQGASIKQFEEDMKNAGYRCDSGVTGTKEFKNNPDTMYFMNCSWRYGFMLWYIWGATAIYGENGSIQSVNTGHSWGGL